MGPDLDIRAVIAEVARKQGVLLTGDDPVLTAALLCEASIKAMLGSLDGRFQAAIDTATENWCRSLVGSKEEFDKAMERFKDLEKVTEQMATEYQRRLEGASTRALNTTLTAMSKQMESLMIDARKDMSDGLAAINAAVAKNNRIKVWLAFLFGGSVTLCGASLWIVYVLNMHPTWFR